MSSLFIGGCPMVWMLIFYSDMWRKLILARIFLKIIIGDNVFAMEV